VCVWGRHMRGLHGCRASLCGATILEKRGATPSRHEWAFSYYTREGLAYASVIDVGGTDSCVDDRCAIFCAWMPSSVIKMGLPCFSR
jgi:hypothetical protein